MTVRSPRLPGRQTLQKGIIILPSAFTLGNLFFGIYAMVAASKGDFLWAGWFIAFAGALDVLDGSVARFTRTGTDFGAELDSLVDAISFGVAPGFILFSLFFSDTQWSWVLSFVYVTAVVVRLARFNINPEHFLWVAMLGEADHAAFDRGGPILILNDAADVAPGLANRATKCFPFAIGTDNAEAENLGFQGPETQGDIRRPPRGAFLSFLKENRHGSIGTESLGGTVNLLIKHEIAHDHCREGFVHVEAIQEGGHGNKVDN